MGNHSFSHLNGFKSKKEEYIYDIELGQKLINEKLVEMGITNKIKIFRPPFKNFTSTNKKVERKL